MQPKLRIMWRALKWKLPRGLRWRNQKSGCSGWRPKRRPCQRCCRSRPAAFGLRSSTTSPSKKATRKRLAPHSATIWMRLSIRSSPMHWSGIAHEADDPALPDGVATVGAICQSACAIDAPPFTNRSRRARRGIRLASSLETGQRLVSREGDLWRWDGFVAAAHAPTGAARRLAQRSRFAEIDSELVSARSEVEANRRTLETAQSAFDLASSTETETSDARARSQSSGRAAIGAGRSPCAA